MLHACSRCHTTVRPTDFYCYNCGLNLHTPPPSTSILRQMLLYIGSVLLPPIGLWWGFKYLKEKDSTSKTVGIICILLTIASLLLTLYLTTLFMNMITSQLNGQMESIQGL